jgi:ADP-ribosyl-[dinitrogen reductase] hydrolase
MKVLCIKKEDQLNEDLDMFWVEVDESEIDSFIKKYGNLESLKIRVETNKGVKEIPRVFDAYKGKYFFLVSKDLKTISSSEYSYPFDNLWNGYSPFVDIYPRVINELEELASIPTDKMYTFILMGALAGDIIGSIYEWNNTKRLDFPFFDINSDFTDDSVMTVAVADILLNNKPIVETFQDYGRRYPNYGYGQHFEMWIESNNPKPYNSWGNGSAMRTAAVGYAFNTEEDILENAKRIAEVTHNHPEGIKGAQATSMCVFMSRNGKTKQEIKEYIENKFNYNLSKTIDEIRPDYKYDVSCMGTVPPAIRAFLESEDYESSIRLAVSIGGDSDTIACITGAIAQAFYKDIPIYIVKKVVKIIPDEFRVILRDFNSKFQIIKNN